MSTSACWMLMPGIKFWTSHVETSRHVLIYSSTSVEVVIKLVKVYAVYSFKTAKFLYNEHIIFLPKDFLRDFILQEIFFSRDSFLYGTEIKTNRSSSRCIWRYHFEAGVWNCQNLNHVAESQLFAFLWDGYHQRLSDLELNQINAFFQLLFPGSTLVSLLESKSGIWYCQVTWEHWKTTIFTSIAYGFHWGKLVQDFEVFGVFFFTLRLAKREK